MKCRVGKTPKLKQELHGLPAELPDRPLLRREVESTRPPSTEVSRCVALILGESGDSRLVPVGC